MQGFACLKNPRNINLPYESLSEAFTLMWLSPFPCINLKFGAKKS